MMTRGANVLVAGGNQPWNGQQQLTATVSAPGVEARRFDFAAQITVPPAVVVAVRPILRGSLIQQADVRLDYAPSLQTTNHWHRLEDVVGSEAARTVAAGQFLQKDWLRQPIVVKRGEMVSVVARSAGLLVRTTGKVRDDGAIGDLVTVESSYGRETIVARVSGPQEVEVFARAVDARATTATANTGVQR